MAISIVRAAITLGALTGGILLVLAGCEAASKSASASSAGSATMPAGLQPAASQMGGAQLWAVTCSHCHNLRSPASYGPYQWEVAMYDMRVRAHLTGEEQREILAFLKSASQ